MPMEGHIVAVLSTVIFFFFKGLYKTILFICPRRGKEYLTSSRKQFNKLLRFRNGTHREVQVSLQDICLCT
jgi:hypothetical protein